MHIVHIALGGCLKAPPVHYGITGDTGGHISYVLGAVSAQAMQDHVTGIEVVTRGFRSERLGPDYARPVEPLGHKSRIVRLFTDNDAYLEKERLEAELPKIEKAFLEYLALPTTRRPDVIHAHFADAAQLAIAAKKRFGIPFVYTPHSLGIDKRDCGCEVSIDGRIAAERRAIDAADAIVASSRDETERQVTAYGIEAAGRTHCVPPGVHVPEAGEEARAMSLLQPFLRDLNKPTVLAVARPVRKKNLAALVEAFGTHPELRHRANLVILAGQRDDPEDGGPEQAAVIQSIITQIDRHDLWGHVAIPRRHAPEDVARLYRLAAEGGGIFVNPALFEPFGLTIVEAARFGLPVVATRNGGPSEIVPRIGHGRLVEPRDTTEIASACYDLISDRISWERSAANARSNARLYSWDNWAIAVARIYAAAIAPRPQPVRNPVTILASDIDGTLTGSPDGVRSFTRWAEERHRVGCLFAVATGRSIGEAQRILARWRLPRPDLFISSVGTEIWRRGPGGLTLCEDYAADLNRNWPRQQIAEVIDGLGVAPQARFEQRPWKLSYLGAAEDAACIRDALYRAGLVARVVASHGRFIDVLPIRAGKARAVAFEAARHGLDLTDCIAAGDSGNDRDMLEQCGHAILPANALAEIGDLRPSSRLARSAAPYADGVVEGLERLGLFAPQRLRA